MSQRIAIVGSGISGLTCGYLLHKKHQIQLFEANDYVGGHTATIDVQVAGKTYAIDTGFIVYNDWTYPNFIKLLEQIGVQSQPTEMSFSVSHRAQDLEYNGHTLNSLFAQRSNMLKPGFWGMLNDIVRFNRTCKRLASEPDKVPNLTLGEFIRQQGYGQRFAEHYILPMCAAIWSASLAQIQGFDLRFFLQFFHNHGLLNITVRPQWRTLIGGSRSYIAPLTTGFSQHIHTRSPVSKVINLAQGYRLEFNDRPAEEFDQVILACHADQALTMLDRPSTQQQSILAALPYEKNDVVLHTDTRLLPKRPLAWASWNYQLTGNTDEVNAKASVTYNMNILQRLASDAPTFCVTLNNAEQIDPNKILRRFDYAHPQFSQQSLAAQQRRSEICGQAGLHFCGAYWYNGFHEDGVRSALDVCARFGEVL